MADNHNREQASLRGRIGAHSLHAKYDSQELTRAAREKFLSRFFDEVDPDRVLSPEQRARRAEHARKVYFSRLALYSAKARARRKTAR